MSGKPAMTATMPGDAMVLDKRQWAIAGAITLLAHGAAAAMLVGLTAQRDDTAEPEPVMIVGLPPEGIETATAPAIPAPAAESEPEPQDAASAPPRPQPVDVPPTRTPAPKQAISLPPPTVMPARPAPLQPARQPARAVASAPLASASPAEPAAPTETAKGAPDSPGDSPKAKAAEADYYSLISAHLNRRKTYPTEAKKAMQQGIVTVRFTVARDGSVSAVSIRKTSGHALLDGATLELMQRVAPLPRFPRSMTKDSVTIALPIEYSLRTS